MAANIKLFLPLKLIFRFLHMFSYAIVFGNVSYDLFVKRRVNSSDSHKGLNLTLNIVFYVFLIISGLTNMLLLIWEKKFNKDFNYEIWKKSLITKFFITLLLTPLLESVISLGIKDEDKVNDIANPLKFTVMLLFTLGSSYLRYFREYYMTQSNEGYIK